MKTAIFRKKEAGELNTDFQTKNKELIDLRFDLKIAKEKDYSRVKRLKKDLARILTVINELKTMNLVSESGKIDSTEKIN